MLSNGIFSIMEPAVQSLRSWVNPGWKVIIYLNFVTRGVFKSVISICSVSRRIMLT